MLDGDRRHGETPGMQNHVAADFARSMFGAVLDRIAHT